MKFAERVKILSIIAGVILLILISLAFPVVGGIAIAGFIIWLAVRKKGRWLDDDKDL